MISLFRAREIIIIFSADQAQAEEWLYLPKKGGDPSVRDGGRWR
jgi:hypothetical protein